MKAYQKLVSFIKHFEEKHANATLFIGIAIGIGVGMYLFSWLVPSSTQLVRMYNSNGKYGHMWPQSNYGSYGMMRYENASITSERQFLFMMINHHKDGVRMAHQILAVPGISTSVTNLAENIINFQNAEIELMTSWLSGKVSTTK